MGKKIDKTTIEYIIAHKDDKPRTRLAQRAGVSEKFLYNILHELGCEFERKSFVPKHNEERDEIIKKLYKDHSVKEIATTIGCHPSTISKAARRMKLSHSEETITRLNRNSMDNLKKAHSKKAIQKRVKSWKRKMRIEKFRLVSGIPRKTKFRFSELPTKVYHAKWHLIAKYGYFAFESEPYIIGYDKNTKRMDEEYYKKKYGFTFLNEEQCQED